MTKASIARERDARETRDVWAALANPTRRAILDGLRDGPRTTGELVSRFPALSRFAVMQHLTVLEEAGLVLVRRQGRNRVNHLNAAPLEDVRQRWLHGFASRAGAAALALRDHVEASGTTSTNNEQEDEDMESTVDTDMPVARARAVRVESELRVAGPVAKVFHALTEEQHEWYPFNYGGDRVVTIVFEPRVGGQCYEDWGDGAGHSYGTVTHYDPPTAFTLRGGLGGGTVLDNVFALVPQDDGSTIVQHSMTAFGALTDDDEHGIRAHGDLSLFEGHLRAWVERGQSVRASKAG